MQHIPRKIALAIVATLAVGVVGTSQALGQLVNEAPAMYKGAASCAAKYPGSFLDVGTGACWQCPSTHPNRTIFPVTGGQACERPATTLFRRASGPERPTGLIGTDCRSGWFLDVGRRACYTCSGYNRTAYAVDHARACSRLVPVAWTTAARKGVSGCPTGSFRNGLTDNCYACPAGYARNAVIADDLTRVNACSQISTAARDATKAKFDQVMNDFNASKDNLGRTAQSMTAAGLTVAVIDRIGRDLMKATIDGELLRQSGFDTVGWLVSAGGSIGAGYSHGLGYVMTKVGDTYQCRKAWSNAFTGGLSSGVGLVIETGFSKGGIPEGKSESNGWQVAASYPPVAAGFGLHWDPASGAMSMALTFGPGFGVDVNFSEYVHTWAENGKLVSCDSMTWGPGWFTL